MPYGDQEIGPKLAALGYDYIGPKDVYGPNAQWRKPDGTVWTQEVIANSLFGDNSPYAGRIETIGGRRMQVNPESGQFDIDLGPVAAEKKAGESPDAPESRYLPDGTYQEWRGGKWVTDSAASDPTKASGYKAPAASQGGISGGVPYSFDPNTKLFTYGSQLPGSITDAQKRQNEVNDRKTLTAAQRAELDQRIAEARASADATAQQIDIQQGTLDFTKSKGEFEMSIGRTKEARETQGQVFSQQAQIATLQFSMAQAQAQAAQWQAQLDSSTDQFNSTMGFNVDRANVEAEANRQQRLQGLATDIGTLAADPGDRGKYAATVLAAGPGQFGAQDAALGATDLRTQQSLTPLQALLGQREGVMAESSTPFKYTPVAARQAAPLNFSGINMPTAATAGSFPTPPAFVPPAARAGMQPNGTFTYKSPDGTVDAIGPAAGGFAPAPAAPIPWASDGGSVGMVGGVSPLTREGTPDWLTKMADGGMAEGAYISGDSNNGKPNEEINIPLGPGQAYVIPKNKVSPAQWKQLQKMAGGGVFSQGTVFGGSTPDTTQASNFLNTASTNARSGTPWAQGKLPTSVYASTPGFDPVVAQLLASLNAQAGGVDQGSFLRLAALQAPTAMQQGVVRRSR